MASLEQRNVCNILLRQAVTLLTLNHRFTLTAHVTATSLTTIVFVCLWGSFHFSFERLFYICPFLENWHCQNLFITLLKGEKHCWRMGCREQKQFFFIGVRWLTTISSGTGEAMLFNETAAFFLFLLPTGDINGQIYLL